MEMIYFIVTIGVLVTIHELGHLIMAKSFNVYCKEFAIGFGPKLFSIQGKETKYTIRLIPFGGYVSMAGEEGVDIESIDPSRTLMGVNKIKRIIIMLAGITFNFVLAVILFCSIYLIEPRVVIPPAPVFAEIVEGSPAEEAGLLANDEVVKVTLSDGSFIEPVDYYELSTFIGTNVDEVTFDVKRGEEVVVVKVTPQLNDELNRYMFGVEGLTPEYRTLSFTESILEGFKTTGIVVSDISSFVAELFQGKGLENIGGPLGIYEVTNEYANAGLIPYLYLLAFLSLNLGILNALPLPILDGGRVVLVIIEAIINKPIDKRVENGLILFSAALLVLLFIVSTFNDIVRLFN